MIGNYLHCLDLVQAASPEDIARNFRSSIHCTNRVLRKCFLPVLRVVRPWNSLPEYVVPAESLDSFKRRLDNCWKGKQAKLDFCSG